jgi:hypothetical protein
MKTPALLPGNVPIFFSLQIAQLTDFPLVGYKAVRDFADNIYEAQFEALSLSVGGKVKRFWVRGHVCYAARGKSCAGCAVVEVRYGVELGCVFYPLEGCCYLKGDDGVEDGEEEVGE